MPKAQKEHTCSLCKRTIFEGDFYSRVGEKYERKMRTLKVCKSCSYEVSDTLFIDADEQLARAEAYYEQRYG